jgi:hypothetical protein
MCIGNKQIGEGLVVRIGYGRNWKKETRKNFTWIAVVSISGGFFLSNEMMKMDYMNTL